MIRAPRARRQGPASAGAREAGWVCYLLECADGTLYAGIARSLARRLRLHERGRASRYTRGRRPVRLVYAEPQPDRPAASRREAQLKRLSRSEKLRLAAGRGRRAPA
jgi:putative endonuclease